jgi:hypothetical protein
VRKRIIEGPIPGVEPDLAEGRGTDNGEKGAEHHPHLRRETRSGQWRCCGLYGVGRLAGSICHGLNSPSKGEKRHVALIAEIVNRPSSGEGQRSQAFTPLRERTQEAEFYARQALIWVFLAKTAKRSICVKTREWVGLILGAGGPFCP